MVWNFGLFTPRYENFINGKEEEKVRAFAEDKEKTLNDLKTKIKYYDDLEISILRDNDARVYTKFFEVNRESYFNMVQENVNNYKNMLLAKLVEDYQEKVER